MTLRLADEPSPDTGEGLALVLVGFRNDVARHRVLPWLREHIESPPAELSLPFTVFAQIDRETGSRYCTELSQLGAMVRLTGDEDTPAAEPVVARVIEEPPPARRASPRAIIGVIALAGLAIVGAFLRWQAEPKPAKTATAAPPAQPAVASAPKQSAKTGQVNGQIRRLMAQGDLPGALQAIESVPDAEKDAATLALKGELHVKRSDWNAACTAYERSVELGSQDPQVFLALAGIYRQEGRQRDAVDMLHRAKENGARGAEFESLKSVVVAEQDAESDFGGVASAHFTLSFEEGKDDAAARLIVSHLEDAYLTVGHKLGNYPKHKIPVVLYAAREFQRVTHSPEWAGALYDGRIKVPVRGLQGESAEIARTMRHEYAHALINSVSGGRCPVWLNEGAAMWAEDDRNGEREEWALGLVQLHPPMRLAQLEKSFGRMSELQAAAAYAQSYLAVQHLVARYGEVRLQRLLAAFATTTSTDEAFRQALSVELASFEDELRRN